MATTYASIRDRHVYPSAYHVEAHMLDAHGISYGTRTSLAQLIEDHEREHEYDGRTIIDGHDERHVGLRIAHHHEPDPDRLAFVYLVEGHPCVGNVADYAKALQHAHYENIGVSDTVWIFDETGQPQTYKPTVVSGPYGEDDYATSVVSVLGDDASFTIDGRA